MMGSAGKFTRATRRKAKLLLHMDGTANSQSFPDVFGHTTTVTGTPKIATSGQTFGTGCAIFDGSAAYIQANHSDLAIGTSDFTLSVWMKPTTLNTNLVFLGSQTSAVSVASAFRIFHTSGGSLQLNTDATLWTGAGVMIANTNRHFEIDRKAGQCKIFVDGTQVGSTFAFANNLTSSQMNIGNIPGYNFGFIGLMDEFQLYVGDTLNWANFTPPVAPYADVL